MSDIPEGMIRVSGPEIVDLVHLVATLIGQHMRKPPMGEVVTEQ